jgi:hypothetical protein
MAVFRIQIFYQRGLTEKWTNVYHADGSGLLDIDAAVTDNMITPLLSLLDPSCSILKYLVSSLTDDTFIERAVNEPGTHFGSGSLLPLFNSMKALFQPADFGRPDLKYYKGLIGEDNSGAGLVSGGQASDADTALTTMIADMTADGASLCSENGSTWSNVSIQSAIQMRQMHRKRKKTTP